MLDDIRTAELLDKLERRYTVANRTVLEMIGEKMAKLAKMSKTDAVRLRFTYNFRSDVDEMVAVLAQVSGKTTSEVTEIIATVADETFQVAKQGAIARGATGVVSPSLIRTAESIAQATNDTLRNISNSTAISIKYGDRVTPLLDAYIDTVDDMILNVQSGTLTTKEAVKMVTDKFGAGLRVDYAGGSRRLDSAVRQSIANGVHEINQRAQDIIGDELGTDGKEISAHGTCAPDHIDVQGKQYTREEWEKVEAGLVRRIGEHNCRHFVKNVFLGVQEPTYTAEQLEEIKKRSLATVEIEGKNYTQYEATQLQRALELEMRKTKDKKALYTAMGDDDGAGLVQKRLTTLQRKYRATSNIAGLPLRYDRT